MNIGIIGSGKMGKRIAEVTEEYQHQPLSLTESLQATEELSFDQTPAVMIDFSHPAGLDKILRYSKAHQVPLVIGTTGYTEEQFAEIAQAAQTIPVLYSANFSLGIMVMNRLIKQAAKDLASWQIELIEKHHSQKKRRTFWHSQALSRNTTICSRADACLSMGGQITRRPTNRCP